MSGARKKILLLFTSTLASGGIQRFNRTLLASFEKLGVDCDVLSLQEPPDEENNLRFGPHCQFRSCGGSKLQYVAAFCTAMWSGRYDLILIGHVNLLRLTVLTSLLFWRSAARLAMVAHGIEVWNSIAGTRRLAISRLWRVLCVSHYTKRRILEQAPQLRESSLVVFPNSLGTAWSRQDAAAASGEPAMGLPAKFILSVTRLDPAERYKGLLCILEALAMTKDPSIHYVIAGSGRDAAFLRSAAQHMGVGERVHFFAGVSDEVLASLYRRCVAFVLPSGKEGFGIVYLEAMFFGAPVIAAREKGVLDVVTDGETGVLVDYGDVIGLANAIDCLVGSDEIRRKLCAAGRLLVTGDGKFTFEAFTTRLAALLECADRQQPEITPLKVQPAPRINAP